MESEEEEDEVIVFRPKLIDNRMEMPLVKDINQEGFRMFKVKIFWFRFRSTM